MEFLIFFVLKEFCGPTFTHILRGDCKNSMCAQIFMTQLKNTKKWTKAISFDFCSAYCEVQMPNNVSLTLTMVFITKYTTHIDRFHSSLVKTNSKAIL